MVVVFSFFIYASLAIGSFINSGQPLDVIHYHLIIEPEIKDKHIKGSVTIRFKTDPKAQNITLSAGELSINNVAGDDVAGFYIKNNKLVINLSKRGTEESQVVINYTGYPKNGLLFNPEKERAHTVYFTSQWMPSNDSPDDRASFSLDILVPEGKTSIASGDLINTQEMDGKIMYQWKQNYETPSYTFGFVIGDFNEATDRAGEVALNYYSSNLDTKRLYKIFEETGNILNFFEQKSGIKYIQSTYSQILIGKHYQEMAGLSVFNESYANSVLKDSTEIHLTSHELAHQWWGNMITCKSFDHFWLNEAFAVYMASAFNEYRFGREKYLSDISLYKNIYDDLIKRGKDKALVFKGWTPSRDNRNVIYYKGAYVLHLLRQEVGDQVFWEGIKSYSQQFFGKSVETADFQRAMEKSADKSLDEFFNRWVYKKDS